MNPIKDIITNQEDIILSGVADGMEALVLADLARARKASGLCLVFVARDGNRLSMIEEALQFFAPEMETLILPAWDCLPYDRVSPSSAVSSQRMATLARLASPESLSKPTILLTSANAALQKMPSPSALSGKALAGRPGNRFDMKQIVSWLENNGFDRTSTVRERGEYAVRGGIIDLYSPGSGDALRLDFFEALPRSLCSPFWCHYSR